MRHGIHQSLRLLATLVVLGGCGGIEHRVAPPARAQALPVFEPPAWNSIENIFLQSEIVRLDDIPRSGVPGTVELFQWAGADS